MLRLMLYVLAFCLTLGFTGCSNDQSEQSEQSGQPTKTGQPLTNDNNASSAGAKERPLKDNKAKLLTVGVMPSMDYLPLAIAEREGYFSEFGVDVTIQLFFSANERDAAFQSNSIDGTVIDYTGAIIQHASGTDLRLTSRCDAPFYLVASPKSGVLTVGDLQNHSVAISQNTVIDYLVDQALTQAGVPEDHITRVEINRIPIRYEMLMANKIDATGLPNPFARLAEKSGAAILTSNQSMNLSITGIMFTGSAIKEKGEQIRQMYLAYDKGVEYIKNHPVLDYQDILIDRFGYTLDILAGMTPPVYHASTLPEGTSIDEVTAWLKARGLIKPDYDPVAAALLDGQFLPR